MPHSHGLSNNPYPEPNQPNSPHIILSSPHSYKPWFKSPEVHHSYKGGTLMKGNKEIEVKKLSSFIKVSINWNEII